MNDHPGGTVCPIHGVDCDYGRMSDWIKREHTTPRKYPSQGPAVMAKPEEDDPSGFEADRQAEKEYGR